MRLDLIQKDSRSKDFELADFRARNQYHIFDLVQADALDGFKQGFVFTIETAIGCFKSERRQTCILGNQIGNLVEIPIIIDQTTNFPDDLGQSGQIGVFNKVLYR